MRSFCWVQLTLMFSSTDIWLLEGRTKNPQHFSGVFDIERERAMLHFMMAARKQKKKKHPRHLVKWWISTTKLVNLSSPNSHNYWWFCHVLSTNISGRSLADFWTNTWQMHPTASWVWKIDLWLKLGQSSNETEVWKGCLVEHVGGKLFDNWKWDQAHTHVHMYIHIYIEVIWRVGLSAYSFIHLFGSSSFFCCMNSFICVHSVSWMHLIPLP